MKAMKLILLAILFTASLHAQNDTAYFDDGSMVIGKGGIKVSIEDGNIVIDGSGITDFVPIDTITRLMPGVCDIPDEQLSPGVFRSCGVYHEPEEVKYVVLKNGAGVTKQERLPDEGSFGVLTETHRGVDYIDDFEWTPATAKLHEVPHPMHINNPKSGDVKIIPHGEEPGMYVFYDKIWYKIPE